MKFKIFIPLLLLLVSACASGPTFKPEVGGPGAKSSKGGGVVYSIPPKNPVLKMNLVSLGINKDNMLQVRMYFIRQGAPAGEYLDPKEQSVTLPDSDSPIYPSKVHANGSGKPLIRLASNPKQGIELMFQLPKGGDKYPFVKLNWKIHYSINGIDQVMAQTERFDYVTHFSPDEGVGQYYGDTEFPYAFAPFPDEWYGPGWMWW